MAEWEGKKSKEHEMSQKGRASLTERQMPKYKYQLDTQVRIFHKMLNQC